MYNGFNPALDLINISTFLVTPDLTLILLYWLAIFRGMQYICLGGKGYISRDALKSAAILKAPLNPFLENLICFF